MLKFEIKKSVAKRLTERGFTRGWEKVQCIFTFLMYGEFQELRNKYRYLIATSHTKMDLTEIEFEGVY